MTIDIVVVLTIFMWRTLFFDNLKKIDDIVVHRVEEAYYEGELVLFYDSCLTGDDAVASEVEHTHTSGRCSVSASYSG